MAPLTFLEPRMPLRETPGRQLIVRNSGKFAHHRAFLPANDSDVNAFDRRWSDGCFCGVFLAAWLDSWFMACHARDHKVMPAWSWQ